MAIDKRKCYHMHNDYSGNDFTFYKKYDTTLDGDMYKVFALQREAGSDEWFCTGTYLHKGNYSSEWVLVLVNKAGVQIETCGYGWYEVATPHSVALKEKTQYNNFLAALAECAKLAPAGASRWHAEMLEAFENIYEEQLFYGDDE